MQRIRQSLLVLSMLMFSVMSYADRGGMKYEKVTYEAQVHKNNVWDVTETFYINFTEPRHGFYRYIRERVGILHDVSEDSQLKYSIINDGTSGAEYIYDIKISNVSVTGGPLADKETDDNGNYIIKIGDKDKEVTGLHKYVIKYTYAYPDDRRRDKDIIFHTILGDDFNDEIKLFRFNVKFDKALPAEFKDNFAIYSGTYGDTLNAVGADVKITSNTVSGIAKNVQPNHAITLSCVLREGYFEDVVINSYIWHYIWLFLSILCLLAIVLTALRVHHPGHVTKTIEFYPPEGISSAEVGMIIDGVPDASDIGSLIPWLAGKGYIKIEEVKKKWAKDTIKLTKLKDLPDDAPSYQRLTMNLFFAKGETVNLDEIGNRNTEMKAIKDVLENEFTGERELQTSSDNILFYLLLWISTTMFFATNYGDGLTWNHLAESLCCWAVCSAMGFMWVIQKVGFDLLHSKLTRFLYTSARFVAMLLSFFVYLFIIKTYDAPSNDYVCLAMYVACFVVVEMIGLYYVNTPYRIDTMGKLLGLKEFIETAEKPRLEALLQDDSQYFYSILPYAMVFGLADKWSDLFKDIDMEKPTWYTGSASSFAVGDFTRSFTRAADSGISTIAHESSSGGAGGGGGGGGGGSW